MKKTKSIGKHSGLSKLNDARKYQAPPIKGTGFEATMQKVSGAGSSKSGAPTKNARHCQPKPLGDTKFEVTMMGKKK